MSIVRDSLDWTWPVGKSGRIRECDNCEGTGNSDAVQVTRKEDGFLWHCFRCKKSGFFSDENASPTEAQEIAKAHVKGKVDTRPDVVTLPHDYTTTLPPKAAVQLYDMELDPDDIDRYDIGWSPTHSRIIIPVYKYGRHSGKLAKKLVGVMGRKLKDDDTDKPKWWSIRQRDIKHPRFIAPYEAHRDCREVVIVEDIFSAIKCAKAGQIHSIALLTTYLPYDLYPVLKDWRVYLWLDGDAYDKACKYMAKLGANGVTANVIYDDVDPKDLSIAVVKQKLQEVHGGDS